MHLSVANALRRVTSFSREKRSSLTRLPSLNKSLRLLDGENPDGAPFGDFGVFAGEDAVQQELHAAGVDAPAGLHGDILFAVYHKRRRLAGDAGVGRELPQQRAARGVERVELTVVGAAAEDQAAAGGEHGSP